MPTDGTIPARQVTYGGGTGMSATDVEAALDELATEKSDVGHTHAPAGITVQDENGLVANGVTQIDFQGAGVTAGAGAGEVVVTIPGGGGGSGTRWEVVLYGSPLEPVLNPAGTDWLYVEVP